jgi:Raf kinase inhibitor-like YbhB/YbcL family protein
MVRLGWALMLMLVTTPGWAGEFQLSSPTIKDQGKISNEHVFAGFGCSGGNVSPALQWKGAPKETKSFALTVYDPDAPTGSGWWHWVIFNLSPTLNALPANAGKPDGGAAPSGSIQSVTDFGQPGYGGPCPPQGDKPHRYIFTLYALKLEQLPLKGDSSGAMVGFYLNQNMIAKASFTAFYGR